MQAMRKLGLVVVLLALTACNDPGRNAAAQEAKQPVSAPEEDVSVLTLVTECDTLAAHPNDPQRMNEGVSDDRIVPRLATPACEQAIKDSPNDPRFSFQLGRALLAAGKKKDAAVRFRKAADGGHAASWAYLGDAYQLGYEGPPDYSRALDAYNKALDGGFETARTLLGALQFDETIFASDIPKVIFTNDLRELNLRSDGLNSKILTRSYIFSLTQKIVAECEGVLSPKNVIPLFLFRQEARVEESQNNQQEAQMFAHSGAGEFDAQALVKRHGCEGPVMSQMLASLNKFFAARPR